MTEAEMPGADEGAQLSPHAYLLPHLNFASILALLAVPSLVPIALFHSCLWPQMTATDCF